MVADSSVVSLPEQFNCRFRQCQLRILMTETGQDHVQQSPEALVQRVGALVWSKSLLLAMRVWQSFVSQI